MIALYLTIFISLIIALVFLTLFLSSVKHGQYEDTYTPSVRMVLDEFDENENEEQTTENN